MQRPDERDILELMKWRGKNTPARPDHSRWLFWDSQWNPFHSASKSKTPRQHYLLEKYEVLQCGDTQKLIRKRHNINDEPVYLVSIEKTFSVIKTLSHFDWAWWQRQNGERTVKKSMQTCPKRMQTEHMMQSPCSKLDVLSANSSGNVPPQKAQLWSQSCRNRLDRGPKSMQGRFSWIMMYQGHFNKVPCSLTAVDQTCGRSFISALGHFLTVGCTTKFAKWQWVRIYSPCCPGTEVIVAGTCCGAWGTKTPTVKALWKERAMLRQR